MDVSATIELLGNMEAVDNLIGGIDRLISKLERLENTANSAFGAFSNVPNINMPQVGNETTRQATEPQNIPQTINWNSQGQTHELINCEQK